MNKLSIPGWGRQGWRQPLCSRPRDRHPQSPTPGWPQGSHTRSTFVPLPAKPQHGTPSLPTPIPTSVQPLPPLSPAHRTFTLSREGKIKCLRKHREILSSSLPQFSKLRQQLPKHEGKLPVQALLGQTGLDPPKCPTSTWRGLQRSLKHQILPKLHRERAARASTSAEPRAGSSEHTDALLLGVAQPRFCDNRQPVPLTQRRDGCCGGQLGAPRMLSAYPDLAAMTSSTGMATQPPLHQLYLKKSSIIWGSNISQKVIASFWAGRHLCFWGRTCGISSSRRP